MRLVKDETFIQKEREKERKHLLQRTVEKEINTKTIRKRHTDRYREKGL